jgi:hypothetical protein
MEGGHFHFCRQQAVDRSLEMSSGNHARIADHQNFCPSALASQLTQPLQAPCAEDKPCPLLKIKLLHCSHSARQATVTVAPTCLKNIAWVQATCGEEP